MKFFANRKRVLILISIICIIMAIGTTIYKTNATAAENVLGYVLTPVQKFFNKTALWISDKINFVTTSYDLYDENKLLKSKIVELETENNRLRLFEEENDKLTKLLETDNKYPDFKKVGAEISARDPSNWYNTFIIDKGTDDNLQNNLVIIADGGLVGRISEVGKTYSKVLTLIDDRSSVSVISSRTGDMGILKGDYTLMKYNMCRMEYIKKDAEILEGDPIVTSNFSDIFPPGIQVGEVVEIKTDPVGLTRYAIIQLVVDFNSIEKVLILSDLFTRE